MEEDNHKIYLADPSDPEQGAKALRTVKRLVLAFILVIALLLSPVPAFIAKHLIPKEVKNYFLSDVYQNIVLWDSNTLIDQPQKFERSPPLEVLGRNTGLCFLLVPTSVDEEVLEKARQNKSFIEVVALSTDNREYSLREIQLSEEDKDKLILCHKFGKEHSLLPGNIKTVYINPSHAFIPEQIYWASVKDIDSANRLNYEPKPIKH